MVVFPAHGALGPLDELLPPIILGVLIGLIVITWWNGRKAVPLEAPQPPETGVTPAGSSDLPAETGTTAAVSETTEPHPMPVPDEDTVSHYSVH